MARKSKKQEVEETENNGEEIIIEDAPEPFNPKEDSEELDDFVDYITTPNITLGTQYRKKIQVLMDGKKMALAIRPLTQDEIRLARQGEELHQGTFQQNIVQTGAYSLKGKEIPYLVLKEKIPAGVVEYIADEILKYSGYGLTEEEINDLKKL